ncbi:unnamed protein product [Didymodactylos carnosus]|uniref:Uncharacterized protein n=1 Tax=Didymodactylos carnosus TaxID=1234261 RepID=A0A814TBM3_9BILA|nr:unnamed protein product [Didymodactylos carnosus]CAF1253477.1 unnamed protein product [Didymodactylos carnosus]CAF3922760.1 unnamed protein product [Didymodactylos carnosus]CAF4060612.1 unnamed protein product [Didymodactylos carnosus]
MWTDRYRNLSYLGGTVSFIDRNFHYRSLEIFCRPYLQPNKTAESTIIALKEILVDFGIRHLQAVNWVSDRGSNFVKGFCDYKPIFCFAHRLNNILKKLFSKKDALISDATTTLTIEDSEESDEQQVDEDDNVSHNISSTIPTEGQKLLRLITECKRLVKFVKKAGLNNEIRESGGKSLKQAVIVTWLSLYECLKSVHDTYEDIRKVLTCRKQQIQFVKKHKKNPSLTFNEYNDDEPPGSCSIFSSTYATLLYVMFDPDVRQFAALCLHPYYKLMPGCSEDERQQCFRYIRDEIHVKQEQSAVDGQEQGYEALSKKNS